MGHESTPLQRIFSKRSLLAFFVGFIIAAAPVIFCYCFQISYEWLTRPPPDDLFRKYADSGILSFFEINFYILPAWFFGGFLVVFPAAYWTFSSPNFRFVKFYSLTLLLSVCVICLPVLFFGVLSVFHFYLCLRIALPLTLLNSIYWYVSMNRDMDKRVCIMLFSLFVLWFISYLLWAYRYY